MRLYTFALTRRLEEKILATAGRYLLFKQEESGVLAVFDMLLGETVQRISPRTVSGLKAAASCYGAPAAALVSESGGTVKLIRIAENADGTPSLQETVVGKAPAAVEHYAVSCSGSTAMIMAYSDESGMCFAASVRDEKVIRGFSVEPIAYLGSEDVLRGIGCKDHLCVFVKFHGISGFWTVDVFDAEKLSSVAAKSPSEKYTDYGRPGTGAAAYVSTDEKVSIWTIEQLIASAEKPYIEFTPNMDVTFATAASNGKDVIAILSDNERVQLLDVFKDLVFEVQHAPEVVIGNSELVDYTNVSKMNGNVIATDHYAFLLKRPRIVRKESAV